MKTLLLLLPVLASCASRALDRNAAEANVVSPTKDISGKVSLKEMDDGVQVVAEFTGLRPGAVHGFHVHEGAKCEGPDFKSAGDHLNPEGSSHAGPGARERHLGDLGNIVADRQGVGRKEVIIPRDEIKNYQELMGRPVILHSRADDLVSQPSGDAGERLACGIIQKVQI